LALFTIVPALPLLPTPPFPPKLTVPPEYVILGVPFTLKIEELPLAPDAPPLPTIIFKLEFAIKSVNVLKATKVLFA
jgi:hypothetical protein